MASERTDELYKALLDRGYPKKFCAEIAYKNMNTHFQQRPVSQLSHAKKYGFVITNPPYGERLEEKRALPGLYQEFGKAFAGLDSWSCYMITSYEEVQKCFGRQVDKNRKIYNGMLKTYFYQFMGLRPPKKNPEQ